MGGIGSGRKPEGKNRKLRNAKLPKKTSFKKEMTKSGYIKKKGVWIKTPKKTSFKKEMTKSGYIKKKGVWIKEEPKKLTVAQTERQHAAILRGENRYN